MMRWVLWSGMIAAFFCPLFLFHLGCGPECIGTISSSSIDPAGRPCSNNCECNNQKHEGYCISGACFSVKRESCDARRGKPQTCDIDPIFTRAGLFSCKKGVRICQDEGLEESYWGNCKCNNDQEEEKAKPELQEEVFKDAASPPESILEAEFNEQEDVDIVCKRDEDCPPTFTKCRGGKCIQSCKKNDDCRINFRCEAKEYCKRCEDGSTRDGKEQCDGKDNDCNGLVDDGKLCSNGNVCLQGKCVCPGSSRFLCAGVCILKGSICVETLAGTGAQGYQDGPGESARFSKPYGVAIDPAKAVYLADSQGNRIRKLTFLGEVGTWAGIGTKGNKNGPASKSQFFEPTGVAIDQNGNVYVADRSNHQIRKIDTQGNVTLFAGSGSQGSKDGEKLQAQFNQPQAIAIDGSGSFYIAEHSGHKVRKIDSKGLVSTIVGSGVPGDKDASSAMDAQFRNPVGIAVDKAGKTIYIADSGNHKIRKVTSDGKVTTLAGDGSPGYKDGTGASAQFNNPLHIDVDDKGNVFVADCANHRIRRIDIDGNVSTLAGSDSSGFKDGLGSSAEFNCPSGIAIASETLIFVGDRDNNRVRKIKLFCKVEETFCSDVCANLLKDSRHCGSCGTFCDSHLQCIKGKCQCPLYTTLCGSSCVDTAKSDSHCGQCNNRCKNGEVCKKGLCELNCSKGQTLCGDKCCKTTDGSSLCCNNQCVANDKNNCGKCGIQCRAGQLCCKDGCADIQINPLHCGACGTFCKAGEVCSRGNCCPRDKVWCSISNKCADVRTDKDNCGVCNNKCPGIQVCSSGRCRCPSSGQILCGVLCVDVNTDKDNCGSCNNRCLPNQSCSNGSCS